MNPRSLVVMGIALCAQTQFASARSTVDLQCESFGDGPKLECTARLVTANGKPLQGAVVTLNAAMPSMPMAHTVAPATALATSQPGEYRGTLQLEMPGEWTIAIDIARPMRDRIIKRLRVDACEQKRRCPALEASLTKP